MTRKGGLPEGHSGRSGRSLLVSLLDGTIRATNELATTAMVTVPLVAPSPCPCRITPAEVQSALPSERDGEPMARG